MAVKDFLAMERKREEKKEGGFVKEITQSFVVGLGVVAIGIVLLFQRNNKKGDKLEDELECEDQ